MTGEGGAVPTTTAWAGGNQPCKASKTGVDSALSDKSSRRLSGDTPYWDLLKNVKYAHKWYVIADPVQRKAWSHADATCEGYAHTVALEGDYFNDDGGCDCDTCGDTPVRTLSKIPVLPFVDHLKPLETKASHLRSGYCSHPSSGKGAMGEDHSGKGLTK